MNMMSHPFAIPTISIAAIAEFAGDGKVYRAFDRLIAASVGSVLLVPIFISRGLLTEARDGCPVPWDEIHDVLNVERVAVSPFSIDADTYSDHVNKIAALAMNGWTVDVMNVNRHPDQRAWRFCHPSGIRYAVVADLVPRLRLAGE